MKHVCFFLLLSFVLAAPALSAQDAKPEGENKGTRSGPKAFSEVITAAAVSHPGLFTVHQLDGKCYFELPNNLLDKEILVVSVISGHVRNLNFGGAGMRSRPQQVVRWQRQDNKILLRSVSYNSVASEELPIYQSVRNNNFEPVVMTFDIAALAKDSAGIVFDATKLFTSDVPMIGPLDDDEREQFKIRGFDKERSLVTGVQSFPENTNIRHILTFNGNKLPDNQLTQTLSVEMVQSFIRLPENPMQPRLQDDRVGYFSITQTDYGLDAHRAERRTYITRWRLEPKDWNAWKRGELVEPVKPIIYYVDPAMPEEWRPYIKQGIEDWQVAFEAIGFKNAILARDPPSAEEDPNWSPEDVRYSVVRYISTDIQNAVGPHVHDPRTGEILESDILWYHNVMNLLRNWFFIQTAAVNPEAQRAKFSDALMGQLIRFVAAHEVGHTLGLPHNMGASSAYPVDSLRAPGFVQRMGVAPSIMDYARFNYVAQPEDKGAGLMPRIGPYDMWSIYYGYRPIPEASSAEAERPILNDWIKARAGDRVYHFGRQTGDPHDPTAQTEDIGSDGIYASQMGIANLRRIVPNLIKWTTTPAGDYDNLSELYGQVIGQLGRYAGHVCSIVGGVYDTPKTADQEGVVYTPVEKSRQEQAVAFINREIFETPAWLLDNDILQRISMTGAADRIGGVQRQALNRLFATPRLLRIIEAQALHGSAAYPLADLFSATREGVCRELGANSPIALQRRNLQRDYVAKMMELMKSADARAANSDIRAQARATLQEVMKNCQRYRNADAASRAHAADLAAVIGEALDVD